MDYILSILIPTKNRKEYLLKCIDEVMSSCSNQVEVVIQDNSDKKWTAKDLQNYNFANLKYYHEFGDISFVDNFSKALENATGEFVCFIGDDDGILPEIEIVANWMKKNDIASVSQNISATYFWPNNQGAIKNTENGLLRIFYANNDIYIKNVKEELLELYKAGGQGYLNKGLVKSYHGIVKREYFQKIKEMTGRYINGLSPDIYAAVALSNYIKMNYVINFPITISGISPKSGAGASANGTHTGKLKDAPHFKGHELYIWDELVPEIYSVETIWADSALHAARDLKISYVDDYFGKEYLLKLCKKKYPQFEDEYKKYMKKYSFNYLKYFQTVISQDIFSLIQRGKKRILRKKEDYVSYTEIYDINLAKEKTREYLQKRNCSIDETLMKIEKMKRY